MGYRDLMSALDHKQTFLDHKQTLESGSGMFALPPEGDMLIVGINVC